VSLPSAACDAELLGSAVTVKVGGVAVLSTVTLTA
jgi:hypothetical protein